MFKKLKLTTKLTLVISAVVMVVFAVLITITVVTSRASIYTGISGELASIAEFNGGEIQSGFDTVERAALGIQDYIGDFTAARSRKKATLTCSRACFIQGEL